MIYWLMQSVFYIRSKQSHLNNNGIASSIHYPTPLPFLKAYNYLGYNTDDFPVSYNYKDKILSLPMYPELSDKQIMYIVDSIKKV